MADGGNVTCMIVVPRAPQRDARVAHALAPATLPTPAQAAPPTRRRGLSPRALERALGFIERRLGEGFSLDELARTVAISRFHFARQFRQSTGCSPMAYLLKLRIARACEQLHAGQACIADTAAQLGFFDQSHFTRTFRRVTGMTPRAYARAGNTIAAMDVATAMIDIPQGVHRV